MPTLRTMIRLAVADLGTQLDRALVAYYIAAGRAHRWVRDVQLTRRANHEHPGFSDLAAVGDDVLHFSPGSKRDAPCIPGRCMFCLTPDDLAEAVAA
jgi:hypothetical protein